MLSERVLLRVHTTDISLSACRARRMAEWWYPSYPVCPCQLAVLFNGSFCSDYLGSCTPVADTHADSDCSDDDDDDDDDVPRRFFVFPTTDLKDCAFLASQSRHDDVPFCRVDYDGDKCRTYLASNSMIEIWRNATFRRAAAIESLRYTRWTLIFLMMYISRTASNSTFFACAICMQFRLLKFVLVLQFFEIVKAVTEF